MSEASSAAERAAGRASWTVRLARHGDLPAIAACVGELLVELGAKPPAQEDMQGAAGALLADPSAGLLLLAQSSEQGVVGFLGVSWQSAIRVPGRYCLIQELWVHPDWRSRAVGGELIATLAALARERGIKRIEVGLPGEGFSHLAATEAFYLNNGFTRNGVRMRRAL